MAQAIHDAGGKVPGFGHPVHKPIDPRAERILELADERGVSGPHVLLARELRDAVARVWGRPLTMNVSLPIAAVLLDLGFPASAAKAMPMLARTAGLLAHLAEEQRASGRLPDGCQAEEAITYEAADARRLIPRSRDGLGGAGRARRRELRAQLAYLVERSPFYREKLATTGIGR